MIQHTVVFRLKHPSGSPEEAAFLDKARALRHVPGVLDFRVRREIGRKNPYAFGLSMHFLSEDAYRAYDAHPDHRRFVEEVWLKEVDDFLEIDYDESDL